MFVKGNTYGKGRPKKKSTILKEFIKSHPYAYDEMLEILYDMAKGKSDREAAQYICDRLKGRPRQEIDQRILKIDINPIELERAIEEAEDYARKMLEGVTDAADKGTEGRVSEGLQE